MRLFVAFIAVIVLSQPIAYAETSGLTPPGSTPPIVAAAPSSAPSSDSYRAATMLTDTIAFGMIAVGVSSSDGGGVFAAGLLTYVLGVPIVHGAHGRWRGFGSFGARLIVPVLGFVVGSGLHKTDPRCGDEWDCDSITDEGVYGFIGGMVLVSAFDTLVLAGESEAAPRPRWTPTVRSTHGGVAVGLFREF